MSNATEEGNGRCTTWSGDISSATLTWNGDVSSATSRWDHDGDVQVSSATWDGDLSLRPLLREMATSVYIFIYKLNWPPPDPDLRARQAEAIVPWRVSAEKFRTDNYISSQVILLTGKTTTYYYLKTSLINNHILLSQNITYNNHILLSQNITNITNIRTEQVSYLLSCFPIMIHSIFPFSLTLYSLMP